MTPVISGDVKCQPVSTLKSDVLNITYAWTSHDNFLSVFTLLCRKF